MKKLFDFIKRLFAGADAIEQKVEQFVEKSDLISPTVKQEVQSALKKVDELEAKTKKVVAKAEVAEKTIETAIKSKDIVSAAAAVESVKEVAFDATSLANDVKEEVKKVKKKRYYKPKTKQTTK